jgi:hypothetical protein
MVPFGQQLRFRNQLGAGIRRRADRPHRNRPPGILGIGNAPKLIGYYDREFDYSACPRYRLCT